MRVKYDVDMNKITSWIKSSGGINEAFESEFEIVWIGYMIERNLIDYLLKNEYIYDTDCLKLEDFDKFYGETPSGESVTKEATHWLQIGTDFMLVNYGEYTAQKFLQKKEHFRWEVENKIMKQYVADNREEFPDAYLELLL